MNWVAWSLLAAFFAAATAILSKVGVAGTSATVATAVRTSVVLVPAWLLVLQTGGSAGLATLSPRTWLFLVLSGLATGLSWLCYLRALQLGPAGAVAGLDKLGVVFVLVLAAAFLGEPLTPRTVAGGLLITAGALLLAWR